MSEQPATHPRPERTVVRPIPWYHGRAHQGANYPTNVQHNPVRSIPGYQQEHVQGLCRFSGQFQLIPDQPIALIRRDAYLRHAHPNLDAFRLCNLRSAPISGGDLFDRSLMQEYEQHLIGLGVKTGTKKERFHPYKKKKGRGGNQRHHAPQDMFYQTMPAPQYKVQQPFYPHPQGGPRGGRGGCRGRGCGGNTSNTKQQQPPQWHSNKCVSLISPWSERNNSFRNSLGLFPPPHPSRGGKDSECTVPSGEGKDSLCTVPSGEGKDSLCTVPSGEGKTPCTKSDIPVGGRLRRFLTQWEHQEAHQSRLSLLRDGYKLPFRERPNLSRVPCITSSYAGSDRQSALLTSILHLLHQGAIEVVHTQNSLGFYSRLFLVPKPGNRWRPVIDLSSLNKFLSIPKFKMETPESIRASLWKGEWLTSIDLTDAYLHVPIHTYSQKYLRFHHKGVTYQFVSLPFGLATAPLVFTSLVKEVKLLVLQQGIRLHQYLDDWLIHAPSKEECHSQT